MPTRAQVARSKPAPRKTTAPKSDAAAPAKVIDESGAELDADAAAVAAAVAEAVGDGVTIAFRGVEFAVPRKVLEGPKVAFAAAFGREGDVVKELLKADRENYGKFLSVLTDDEDTDTVLAEFYEAVNAAAGTGNS